MAQLLSASLLVLLAAREAAWSLGSQSQLPLWVELLGWFLIMGGLVFDLAGRASNGRAVRASATLCLIFYLSFARGPELFFEIGPAFAQSRRAELLSTIVFGFPVYSILGLIMLVICSAGLFELLLGVSVPERLGPRVRAALCVILCSLFFGFGLLALFSYGSGSPLPFLT